MDQARQLLDHNNNPCRVFAQAETRGPPLQADAPQKFIAKVFAVITRSLTPDESTSERGRKREERAATTWRV